MKILLHENLKQKFCHMKISRYTVGRFGLWAFVSYHITQLKEQLEYETRVVDNWIKQEVMGGVKNFENIEKVESARCSA